MSSEEINLKTTICDQQLNLNFNNLFCNFGSLVLGYVISSQKILYLKYGGGC